MSLLRMAWRNVFRNTRRSILTGLAMVGGFVLSSLSLAIIEGTFGDSVKAYTLAGAGQIQVHRLGYLDKPTLFQSFPDAETLGRELARVPDVIAWTPRLYAPALAFIGTRTTAARLIGVDPVREPETTRLLAGLELGQGLTPASKREVVLANGLAESLHAEVGGQLVLIGQAADGSIANEIFTVAGILRSGSGLNGAHACYLPLAEAQEFLGMPGRVHELTVMLKDYRRSRPAAREIAAVLRNPGLEVKPWEDIEQQFYQMVQSKKKGNRITMLIIYIIICLGVVNTVTMSLLERTREFGVLKALGTRPGRLMLMIQFEIGWLALLACAAGTILSLALDTWLSVHGIRYPRPMDIGGVVIEKASAVVSFGAILVPAFLTLASAQVVTLLVAWRAARLDPVRAMRQT